MIAVKTKRAVASKQLSPSSPELLVDIDDLLHLGAIDRETHFLSKAIMDMRPEDKADGDKVEHAWRCAFIDLLRSDIPIGRYTRSQLANTLVTLWWPRKRQRQRTREQAWLLHERALIDYLAERYRGQGARNPRTNAEREAAVALGFGDVEGLRKARYRYRKRART
jgi:hypothetical protein